MMMSLRPSWFPEPAILALSLCLRTCFALQDKDPPDRTPEDVKLNLRIHKIVPDVLDYYPETAILIRYSEFVNANLGNELKYEDIEEYVPLISWKADENKFYTLMMLDPDYPSSKNPVERCWNHWLVGNIPRHHVMMGQHLIKYQETRPANGTGYHRYVGLIYEQPNGKIQFNEPHLKEFSHVFAGIEKGSSQYTTNNTRTFASANGVKKFMYENVISS